MGRKSRAKQGTTKKERQAAKEAQRLQDQKTIEERSKEVGDIKERLESYDVTTEYDAVKQLFAVLDHYVLTGEGGSGKIPFPEAPPPPHGRMIVYVLNNSRRHNASVNLIVRNGQQYLK